LHAEVVKNMVGKVFTPHRRLAGELDLKNALKLAFARAP